MPPPLPVLVVVLSKKRNTPKRPRVPEALALNQSFQELRSTWGWPSSARSLSGCGSTFQCGDCCDPHNLQARTLLDRYYGEKRFTDAAKHLGMRPKQISTTPNYIICSPKAVCLAKQYTCALEEFRHILQRDPDSATRTCLWDRRWTGWQKTRRPSLNFRPLPKFLRTNPTCISDLVILLESPSL